MWFLLPLTLQSPNSLHFLSVAKAGTLISVHHIFKELGTLLRHLPPSIQLQPALHFEMLTFHSLQ